MRGTKHPRELADGVRAAGVPMKHVRHGNKRSHRAMRRHHARVRKEHAEWVAFKERMRVQYEEYRRIDTMAYEIFGRFMGRWCQ